MTRPRVSIVVPTYDRAMLLPRALDSIVAQTFCDWEIVLVDDGSTDETAAVAARYAAQLGRRFHFIRLGDLNRGSSAARNRGIDKSRGRFVAFLDSDDEFLPRKLERQLALFACRPELGFVYSDYAFVDLDGVRHESMFDTKADLSRAVAFQAVAPGLCACLGDLFDVLLRGYFIATIVGMVRREVLGASIRFPENQTYAEEWLFYLKVCRACRAGFVDEPLSLHHHTRGSLARTDKHRNTLRYRHLLRGIYDSFDDLTGAQRRAVRLNLAHACRQLGYDALRTGKEIDALARFVESLRYEFGFHRVCDLARVTMGRLLQRAGWLARSPVAQPAALDRE